MISRVLILLVFERLRPCGGLYENWLGLQNLAWTTAVALHNISPSYLHYPRVMKHVWVLYFDTQIMILIFELSMSRCTCKAHRVVLTPGHSEIMFSWDIVGLKGFGPVGASWRLG
jgi:hypothetical protein